MSPHADTALDQLRLADSCDNDRAGEHLGFLAAAIVHAVLALADEVRRAYPPMYQLVQVPPVDRQFEQLVGESAQFKPTP